jgi:hypothetical protein
MVLVRCEAAGDAGCEDDEQLEQAQRESHDGEDGR